MPLSEYEQRVLEQMERALTSDDPRLASTLQQTSRRSPMRYVIAGLAVVVGLLLLVLGAATSRLLVGVIGFVLMFAGVAFAFASPKPSGPVGVVRPDGTVEPPAQAAARPKNAARGPKALGSKARPAPGKNPGKGFLGRLEERWDRRREQGR